jgi:peptide/nickel transport system ATP-binding protein
MLTTTDLHVELAAEAGLVRALDGLALSIDRGETFALVGESGCGKSMTALALMRLLPDNGAVTAGSVKLHGDELLTLPERRMRAVRGKRIAMIFQEPATSLNPVLRVGDQILETIVSHTALRGQEARARAIDWLRRVGIPEPERRIDSYPFEMSGGQKQRVMIAIALAAEPDFLIADEPTTALDVTIQKQVLDLLRELQRERQLGLLLITHDLAVVAGMAHRVALMYAGQIVEQAEVGEFFAHPRHPYARLLLQALPEANKRGGSLAAITGTVPPLWTRFEGCRFAPRCDRAQARCKKAPPLEDKAPGHPARCWFPVQDAAAAVVAERPATGALEQPAAAAAAASGASLLVIENLSVRFPVRGGLFGPRPAPFTAVDGVSLRIEPGRTLALVGESGCGKTTIGRAITQLLRGTALIEGRALLSGRDLFTLQGEDLVAARREIQIVFQDPYASLNPRMRVVDILEEGLQSLRRQWTAVERRQRLLAMMDQVGLREDALERYPHEFSGGQRQRIAIARALAVEPALLVCDEPTSALDVSVQAQILNLLKRLQRERGLAYLFITHNMGVVEYLADEVAVMRAGRIVESGSAARVLGQPQQEYTRTLLAAVPKLRQA